MILSTKESYRVGMGGKSLEVDVAVRQVVELQMEKLVVQDSEGGMKSYA